MVVACEAGFDTASASTISKDTAEASTSSAPRAAVENSPPRPVETASSTAGEASREKLILRDTANSGFGGPTDAGRGGGGCDCGCGRGCGSCGSIDRDDN